MNALVRSARNFFNRELNERRYMRIYEQFSQYTMLSASDYINTLRLAEECRAIEGCVAECGVWKGGMAAGLVSVLGAQREYFLFDSFEGLPMAQRNRRRSSR